NGPSFGFGAGAFGNVLISKKIKMELALNEYYFFIRCKQKTERKGSYDGKVMNSPGNYNLYNGEYSYKKENDLRSARWSKLSVRLSFSYCF
ncbi:MAG: hypothetical protein IAF38_08190, partial [Bacteroidia bacterium]|nr:hypothetical protein [Bacteroidia bacterium]